MGKVKVKGTLKLEIVKDGEIIERVEQQNIIVSNGLAALAGLLAGTSFAITKVRYGTDKTATALEDNGLTDYTELSITDTEVVGSLLDTVKYEFTMGTGDGNGKTFWEAGLVSSTGVLFNRVVLTSPLVKNNTISINGIWEIQMV